MDYKTFKISRRVIQHLGKDLITTPDVAVTELLKNSIDAGAKDIRIHLSDKVSKLLKEGQFAVQYNKELDGIVPEALLNKAACVIEDTGIGMDTRQLDKGFLTVGTNIKKESTNMMFGEKGIGRLAAQRLGNVLLIETASKNEPFANVILIDWKRDFNSASTEEDEVKIPYYKIKKVAEHYTRLWILDVSLLDFLETPEQLLLNIDGNSQIIVNKELQTAINFLLSPFSSIDNHISMYYGTKKLNVDFPYDLLQLAESEHSFHLCDKGGELALEYQLKIEPWYVERLHRAAVKNEAFKKLKKAHVFYEQLLNDNQERVRKVLHRTEQENTLKKIIFDYYWQQYKGTILDKKTREDYAWRVTNNTIDNLKKIVPIKGKIYTFKQGVPIGERIIISAVNENRKAKQKTLLSLDALSGFLSINNGVKLYRDDYRIGFLGNRESDWLNLQQYSTKGQQFYRFDPSNTIGFVSVHDIDQIYIQEISSRLDISQNEVSVAFKSFINIIFNRLFYSLTRTSYNIIKVLLEEQGLLNTSLEEDVKKKTIDIKKSIGLGKEAEKELEGVRALLAQDKYISNSQVLSLSLQEFQGIQDSLYKVANHLATERENQQQAIYLLTEAGEQLKAVEIEAYNNFKLMANGLITETITHELDSVCRTSVIEEMDVCFDNVKGALLKHREISTLNNDLLPIKSSYYAVAEKMKEVAELYNFIEKTFIRRGTYDEFEYQNIRSLIDGIRKNLIEIEKGKIIIECDTGDLAWYVPKGVLVHVFYNLISNSIYWIDRRRKRALSDELYKYEGADKIVIQAPVPNEIIIYDTGTGVSKNMEDILFQPLESGKENNTGRGMGLYIVQQLLRSFSADIWLDAERNLYGNRYKFIINLGDGLYGNV